MAGWRKKLFGDRGERTAARYLKRLGFKILLRQYSSRWGEIDLVALDAGTVVFVEVKTRRSSDAGRPFEAVTRDKQKRLTRAALAFLKRQGWLERPSRFDVVAITWPEGARDPEIVHYQNAFEAVGQGQMYS